MTRPALTTTLTLLLVAEQRRGPDAFEYAVYEVIERLLDLAAWTDEKKADLYAMLVEGVACDSKLFEIERTVGRCLVANAHRFPHG